jgi:hypothetical protein
METDSYSSHLHVFEKLIGDFKIYDVLEFGMGMHSTPFLAKHCGRVVSVEQESQERYDQTVAMVKSPNWEPFFECNPATVFEYFERQNRRFDMVFSDGVPQTRSMIANLAMRKNIPFVVLHDAEMVWHYRWHLLDIPNNYYRFNFKNLQANKVTTIIASTGQAEIEKWDMPGFERVVLAYSSPKQPVLEVKLHNNQPVS